MSKHEFIDPNSLTWQQKVAAGLGVFVVGGLVWAHNQGVAEQTGPSLDDLRNMVEQPAAVAPDIARTDVLLLSRSRH